VVSQATRAAQKICWSTIAALATEAQLPAPSILLVGRVATQSVDEWPASFASEAFQKSAPSDLPFPAGKQN
jgi:siroheme synthase